MDTQEFETITEWRNKNIGWEAIRELRKEKFGVDKSAENIRSDYRREKVRVRGTLSFLEERVGFLDIEASNLDASFGVMICYCIKVMNKNQIYSDIITTKDIKAHEQEEDYRITKSLIGDLENFDRIVTHYGCRFDMPFIRTRALINNLNFPVYGKIVHEDNWYIARHKLKMHSNRLAVLEETLIGRARKTRLKPKVWRDALRGHQESLDYILDHCKRDTRSLEDIWKKIEPFKKHTKASA